MQQRIEVVDGTPSDVGKRLTALKGQHPDAIIGDPSPIFNPVSNVLAVVVLVSWLEPKPPRREATRPDSH